MSAVTFTVDFTGSPDADDILAAKHIIALENKRRANLPEPLTPLPSTTAGEIKTSYLLLLTELITTTHDSYIAQAKSYVSITQRFTATEIAQMFANVIARLNAGESSASIVADTAS